MRASICGCRQVPSASSTPPGEPFREPSQTTYLGHLFTVNSRLLRCHDIVNTSDTRLLGNLGYIRADSFFKTARREPEFGPRSLVRYNRWPIRSAIHDRVGGIVGSQASGIYGCRYHIGEFCRAI